MALFSSESPTQVGKDVVSAYFNEARNFPEFPHKSYEAFLTYLNNKVPDFEAFVGDLVLKNRASTTVGQAKSRLAMLANKSAGRATIPQLVQAAGGTGTTVNWSAALPEVAKETAKEVTATVQSVGKGIVSTFKLAEYLPIILLAGGALAIYTYSSSAKKLVRR